MDKYSRIKLLALLGFFQLLAPSLADNNCTPFPKKLANAIAGCGAGLSDETLVEFMTGTEPNDERLKNFSLCFYTSLKWYREGAFDLEYMKKFLENSHPDQQLMHRIYEWNAIRMEEANDVEGEDMDKTYRFWLSTYDAEIRKLTENLWCST